LLHNQLLSKSFLLNLSDNKLLPLFLKHLLLIINQFKESKLFKDL